MTSEPIKVNQTYDITIMNWDAYELDRTDIICSST